MIKKGSKVIIVLLIILYSMPFTIIATPTIPNPSKEFYVYDEASLLDIESKNYILGVNEILHRKTGAQIVVAIVNDTEELDIETYSLELFRKWGIGSKDKNNGVLLIVSLKEKEVRIEVGYGLEGAIPDSKAGRILDDYIVPQFRNGNYKQGVIEAFKIIVAIIEKEYNVEIDKNINLAQYELEETISIEKIKDMALIVIICLTLIAMDMIFNRARFIRFIIRMSCYANLNGNSTHSRKHSGHFGGGGSSGGGGASRKW